MNTTIRTKASFLLILAALCGCSAVRPVTSTIERVAARIFEPSRSTTAAPVAPPSRTLDAYKAEVAQHVMRHNPSQTFSGRLPPMLPAIVVLNITVNKDGDMRDVEVQRSRDPDASRVALDSLRRSGRLPKPSSLLAQNSDEFTFSETFLFDSQYRFQLRSLAGPQ